MYRGFWYEQALSQDDSLSPSLNGSVLVDTCIVGGGYLGLWSAIRLKKANPAMRIAIIERDRCGGGASGRNGGLATNWWAKYLSLVSICGIEEAVRICEAAESAIDEIGEFCQDHGIDAQYRKDGWLWTASNARQVDSWLVLTDLLDRAGVNPFRPSSHADVLSHTGSQKTLTGIFDPNAATVQPAMLGRGLRRVALELGVAIYENTPLIHLERGRSPSVKTPKGEVRAKKVVIALNAWGTMFPELRRMVAVMSSDMVATAPAAADLSRLGFTTGIGMTDSRTILDYWRNTPDGRIVFGKPLGHFAFGGRVGNRFDGPSPVADRVEATMRSYYPELGHVPVVSNWTGPVDRSMKGLPNFGYLDGNKNIAFGIGFSGNGVGTTVFASRIIKSLVEGADDEWSRCGLVNQHLKLLPPEPFRYVGGHFVRDALVRKESLEDQNRDAGWLTNRLAALAPAGYVPSKKY